MPRALILGGTSSATSRRETTLRAVAEQIDWLVAAHNAGDPKGVLPRPDDSFFARYFDYSAEDRWLAGGRTR